MLYSVMNEIYGTFFCCTNFYGLFTLWPTSVPSPFRTIFFSLAYSESSLVRRFSVLNNDDSHEEKWWKMVQSTKYPSILKVMLCSENNKKNVDLWLILKWDGSIDISISVLKFSRNKKKLGFHNRPRRICSLSCIGFLLMFGLLYTKGPSLRVTNSRSHSHTFTPTIRKMNDIDYTFNM